MCSYICIIILTFNSFNFIYLFIILLFKFNKNKVGDDLKKGISGIIN